MGNICDVSEIILELGLSASITDEERSVANVALRRVEGIVKRHLQYDPVQQTHTEYYPKNDFGMETRVGIWEATRTTAYLRRRIKSGNDELQIKNIPIRSITSLFVDYDGRSGTQSGAFGVDTEKVEGTDFWPNYDAEDDDNNSLCRDGIIRSIGAWPITPGSIKIVYVSGYTDAELHGQGGVVDASPIVDVIISESARKARKAFVEMKTSRGFFPGPIRSEKLGDYAVSFSDAITSRLFGNEWSLMPESLDNLESFVNWGMVY